MTFYDRFFIFLYQMVILAAGFIMPLLSVLSPKIKAWQEGRIRQKVHVPSTDKPLVWMHCASLGEWEQGRPVLEALQLRFPDHYYALTFFSPSGYDKMEGTKVADWIGYLPLDTPFRARQFVDALNPVFVIWVKYDFWLNIWRTLQAKKIPLVLIAARLRKNQLLFKSIAAPFLKVILKADFIFTQDELTFNLLRTKDGKSIAKAGDTRVDRVLEIAAQPYTDETIAAFSDQGPTLLAGSIWEKDFDLIASQIENPAYRHWNWILAPHDPKEALMSAWERRLEGRTVRYSAYKSIQHSRSNILIVDTVGILKYIYRYSQAVFIGGGFGKSIHNTLEPAAYGLPIAFGPHHHKFPEAEGMIEGGGAFCVETADYFEAFLAKCDMVSSRKIMGKSNLDYVQNQSGATATILPVLSDYLTRKS